MENFANSKSDAVKLPYWKERATCRRFDIEEIPDELLFNLIDKACKAPTTGGMQLYSVVITRERKVLEELYPAHFNQPAATGARLLLTVVADFNRFDKWCRQRGADPGFDNFQSFVAAFLDATIFAQQLTTLLELTGLGVCYLGTTTYNAREIGRALDLPRLVVPVTTLAVGFPAGEGVETERLPAGAIIHREKYGDYTPERIEEIFAVKENYPANKEYVRENGLPSLAHVFTDVRYPRENAEKFSRLFADYIKQQGFTL